MIFTYRKWERFCRDLEKEGRVSIPAREVNGAGVFLTLKHDVETNVKKAHRMARIEQKYGHRGSFYVQAYLLRSEENVRLLRDMKAMGHEISYHYDVMDACRGDLALAMAEFEKNKCLFENNGFELKTVCQHGNPVVARVGYTSNRDFFRATQTQAAYPYLSDIMVDYPQKHNTSYLYFSDAGRRFHCVFDPFNNDRVKSDDRNIAYRDLVDLRAHLSTERGNIISTHPHRWERSAVWYGCKTAVFYCARAAAKLLMKIPFMKKWMSKYYYLAKKI